jgi:N-acetylmuramoyl-L-alanine amidase
VTARSGWLPRLFGLLCLAGGALAEPPLIAVDVGHTRCEGGAISARGQPEFDFNLALAHQVAAALRARQLVVREINFDGSIPSLGARTEQAAGGDVFVSIHHDAINEAYLIPWIWNGVAASYSEEKRGYGLFISPENPDYPRSRLCALAIGGQLRQAGFTPTPWHQRKHQPVDADLGVWHHRDKLVVLYRTTLPAILVEAGVIKHREEELELLDPQRQARMAAALAAGIMDCLAASWTSDADRKNRPRRDPVLPDSPPGIPESDGLAVSGSGR